MKVPDRIEIIKNRSTYFLDNKEVTKKAFRKRHPLPKGSGIFGTAASKAWPLVSTSQGCHPKERKKFMEHFAKLGVPTEFNAEGRAVFTSRAHQRRYGEVTGRVNYDDNWSGKGPVAPPPPPKKRPRMGKANQQISKDPPQMRTQTRDCVDNRSKRSRRKSR